MSVDTATLPGSPPPVLSAVLDGLEPATRARLVEHLVGGTSAEWIAGCLKRNGRQIGATSIKSYRRSLHGKA